MLAGTGPRITFNGLATKWERSEQTGIATLMKGLFSTSGSRRPRSKVASAISRKDAGHAHPGVPVHRRLDKATVR